MENRKFDITWETKVEDLLDDERICLFGKRMGLNVGVKRKSCLREMVHQNPAWEHADMMKGFQRMLELLDEESQFCNEIYSDLEKKQDKSKKNTALYHFPAKTKGGPFVLIAPGGAYVSVACTVEGFPIAAQLNEKGIHAFVLNYRTGIGCLNRAKEDYIKALQFIFEHAKELGVTVEKYAVMGFSAGAHLTSFCGTACFDWEKLHISRPSAIILGYPLQNFTEGGAIIRMCKVCAFGFCASSKKLSEAYVPGMISATCPPVYIWQTRDDESVPFEDNGNALYSALKAAGIYVKMRVAEHGPHGMGIARCSEAAGWLEEAVDFWKKG